MLRTRLLLEMHLLLTYADDKVKGQLKDVVPNAHQQLLNICPYSNDDADKVVVTNTMIIFSGCIKHLVDCGIAVTPDDLKAALDNGETFVLHHFLCQLNLRHKEQLKTRSPDMLVRVLSQCGDKNMPYGSWLVDLVKYLLDWFDIDVNYSDPAHGFVLHNLFYLFDKWSEYSATFLQILKFVLKKSELDIDLVQVIRSDHIRHKKARIEMSPLEYALDHGLVEVVNRLLVAGAKCNGLDVIDRVKGHNGAANTFCILYSLGHSVEVSELHVRITTHSYKREYEQLKVCEQESARIKTLKEMSVMRVKRDMTRFEMNGFIREFKLRPEIEKMLKFKHVDRLKRLIDA